LGFALETIASLTAPAESSHRCREHLRRLQSLCERGNWGSSWPSCSTWPTP